MCDNNVSRIYYSTFASDACCMPAFGSVTREHDRWTHNNVICYIANTNSYTTNWKKPALTRVQNPHPLFFVRCDLDLLTLNTWVSMSHGGTFLCCVLWSWLDRFLRYPVEKHDVLTNASEKYPRNCCPLVYIFLLLLQLDGLKQQNIVVMLCCWTTLQINVHVVLVQQKAMM